MTCAGVLPQQGCGGDGEGRGEAAEEPLELPGRGGHRHEVRRPWPHQEEERQVDFNNLVCPRH